MSSFVEGLPCLRLFSVGTQVVERCYVDSLLLRLNSHLTLQELIAPHLTWRGQISVVLDEKKKQLLVMVFAMKYRLSRMTEFPTCFLVVWLSGTGMKIRDADSFAHMRLPNMWSVFLTPHLWFKRCTISLFLDTFVVVNIERSNFSMLATHYNMRFFCFIPKLHPPPRAF